jgi:AraC-like DNA-binding protein
MASTLLASSARVLWRLLQRNGIDPRSIFVNAGLDPAKLSEPRSRYDTSNARAAWFEAVRAIPDPCFGLQASEEWRATDFHALGYAFLSSRTLSTGLARIVRYNAVVDTTVEFQQTLEDNLLRLTYRINRDDLAEPPALENARWAVVLGMCREAYGPTLDPLQVSFTHPPPSQCTGAFFGFFRCPVHFGAAHSELILDRRIVEQELPALNRELASANDAVLSAYVAQLDDDLLSRVRAAIIARLPSGAPSAADVARDLHMSARTLQRRLADEQTSYSALLDAVRQELATRYLSESIQSLSEITYLLGFSELSAFSRAYRRWTGQSPGVARSATAR